MENNGDCIGIDTSPKPYHPAPATVHPKVRNLHARNTQTLESAWSVPISQSLNPKSHLGPKS